MKPKYTYGVEEALTPLDGRNKNKVASLTTYFSDFALNKHRVLVELKYLLKLSEYKIIRKLTPSEIVTINQLIVTFDKKEYRKIREIELRINHDMKAVEEYLTLQLAKTSLKDLVGMVHFGLTSDDVNNVAYGLMVKNSLKKIILPEIEKIIKQLQKDTIKYKNIAMLGRTHGQSAAPTTVGKELLVYYKRLDEVIKRLRNMEIRAKLTGNTGNLNAHKFIFPNIDWLKFSSELVESLGLTPNLITTQIEPYDSYIHIFNQLLTINNILLGLSQDFWIYLMLGYFRQKVIKSEVGSTALPHKVNPIYFEGAEGGLGIANSLLEFYCRKLSYSRLQRDLSDSTVRRSFGIAFGYSYLSYQSITEALKRIEPDGEKIREDLENHWEVLSEAIQNFLRTQGYENAYEKTKKFFRGRKVAREDLLQYINKLKLNKKDKEKLSKLTPEKYTGYAGELVTIFSKKQ
ncbi:adenylosuccinate lyase [Candidatus Roizmanbacteria bacterium]|nr:adenylosuccinate lyase [Candidatus Roizmanbacteria bacterium]